MGVSDWDLIGLDLLFLKRGRGGNRIQRVRFWELPAWSWREYRRRVSLFARLVTTCI